MRKRSAALSLIIAVAATTACHRSKDYETMVEVTRVSAVRKDEAGQVQTLDLELRYLDCPGRQIEVIRGGPAFAQCIHRVRPGDKVAIKIHHVWTSADRYDAEIYEVERCARPPDPDDDASYKMVRECTEWNVNGTHVGFECSYARKQELNARCPWFATR